jgi:hypothetical protein
MLMSIVTILSMASMVLVLIVSVDAGVVSNDTVVGIDGVCLLNLVKTADRIETKHRSLLNYELNLPSCHTCCVPAFGE